MAVRFELFVSCLPGLESLLASEAENIGLPARPERGGIAVETDARGVLRANLELGLASHVLVRVGRFRARSLGELRRRTAALPWCEFLRRDVGLEVRAASSRSRLYHGGAIAQRVAEGVADALGGPPAASGEGPCAVVAARLLRDECVLSLDTSGEPLHRRGWRLERTRAVLREDLARALVLASGWEARAPLVDPMAGSGTIPIEAAGLARRLPPGRSRAFAFEHTGLFDPDTWRSVLDEAMGRALDRVPAPVGAGDRDAGAEPDAAAHPAPPGVGPVHQRRTRAVLREDLARALVLASGWEARAPLVDPMAGSGTIPIEAAGLARRLPPGRSRTFAFEHTALFDPDTWRTVRERAMGRALDRAPAWIGAGDRDAGAIETASANAARAGVREDLEIVHAALGTTPLLSPSRLGAGAAVVTDPPFGRRLRGRADPRPLYQTLGRRLAESPGLLVALVCAERRLALRTGLALRTACITNHGGLRVRLMVGRV